MSSTEKVKYTLSLSKKGELDWMTLIEVLQNRYFVCVGGSGGVGHIKVGSQAKTFSEGTELTKNCHTGPD